MHSGDLVELGGSDLTEERVDVQYALKDVDPALVFLLNDDTSVHAALGQPSVAQVQNLSQGATPAQSRTNLLAWLDHLLIGSGRQQAARLLYQDGSPSTIYHHLSSDIFLDFVQKVATGTLNQWSGECRASEVSAGAIVALHNQESVLHGRHLSFGPFISHTT